MQTGKAHMAERATWESLCGNYQKTACFEAGVRVDRCMSDVRVYRYNDVCASAASQMSVCVCECA